MPWLPMFSVLRTELQKKANLSDRHAFTWRSRRLDLIILDHIVFFFRLDRSHVALLENFALIYDEENLNTGGGRRLFKFSFVFARKWVAMFGRTPEVLSTSPRSTLFNGLFLHVQFREFSRQTVAWSIVYGKIERKLPVSCDSLVAARECWIVR